MNKVALLVLSVMSLASHAVGEAPNYQRLSEAITEIRQHCGYDAKIEVVKNNKKKSTHPTIGLHGFGDSKEGPKRRLPDDIPGDIICFNFKDAEEHGLKFLTESSIGQKSDMMPLLIVLKALSQSKNVSGVNIFGHSRGGQTAWNTIGALNQPSDEWKEEFKKIGITDQIRKNILEKIQKGVIVSMNPLTDVNAVLRKKAEQLTDFVPSKIASVIPNFLKPGPFNPLYGVFNFLLSIGSASRKATVCSSVKTFRGAVSVGTNHKPEGEQAIKSLDLCKGLNLKTLLSFQHNDEVLGNSNDVPFAKKLIENNPETTWVVLGNDWGHNSGFRTVGEVIPALYNRYGGVEGIDQNTIDNGNEILDHSRLSVETVEECINGFYEWCNKR